MPLHFGKQISEKKKVFYDNHAKSIFFQYIYAIFDSTKSVEDS